MKILLAVDVQREFAKGFQGKALYKKLVTYIDNAHKEYDKVIALKYENRDNVNMRRLVGWSEMKTPEDTPYKADEIHMHSGYTPTSFPIFNPMDEVTVIGFDTDACVLASCFRLFDNNVKFRILAKGVCSSGGRNAHNCGLTIMKRQFGKAVDTDTDIVIQSLI